MYQQPQPADKLAATYNMGTFLKEYHTRVTGSNIFYGVLAVLLITGLSVEGTFAHEWIAFIPIIIVIILVSVLLETTRWLHGLRMVVCTEGLIRVWNEQIASIRWDEIRELWLDGRGVYTFSRTDGTRFIINHVFQHAEELGATIEKEVTQRLLPALLKAYYRGDVLCFGIFSVSQRGLSAEGQTLPWSELDEFLVQRGVLLIKQNKMKRNWLAVSLRDTPNLCVLEALIQHIFITLEGTSL
jgi:hypothetical protein